MTIIIVVSSEQVYSKEFIMSTVFVMKKCIVLLASFYLTVLFCMTVYAEPLKILTVNVRLSTAKDGKDAWAVRRDALADVIRKVPYDFIGGQEVVINPKDEVNQFQFLSAKLPEYRAIYRSREKSEESGEGTPVFYRKDRWETDEKDNGVYWLSDTPNVPGSITWKGQSNCPRVVTGGLFYEKGGDGKRTGKSVYVYSTHFDHVGEIARQKAADFILQRINTRKDKSVPVILMGDFNAGEDSPTIRFLKGETVELDGQTKTPPMALIDSFRAVHPDEKDVATFQGFKEHNPKNTKIDYIFSTKELKATSAEIIRCKTPEGRFPTDHYPVSTVLEFAAP
jgi:endonuclease/exonuclease/phosphatase family metal-dependent hydrolase